MTYKPGTELIVITNLYKFNGRTKGSVVIATGKVSGHGILVVTTTGDGGLKGEWFYREDEVVPLTKLHKVLR